MNFCVQETGVYELNCLVRVDEFGFFIYWKSDGKVRLFSGNKDLIWWLKAARVYVVVHCHIRRSYRAFIPLHQTKDKIVLQLKLLSA